MRSNSSLLRGRFEGGLKRSPPRRLQPGQRSLPAGRSASGPSLYLYVTIIAHVRTKSISILTSLSAEKILSFVKVNAKCGFGLFAFALTKEVFAFTLTKMHLHRRSTAEELPELFRHRARELLPFTEKGSAKMPEFFSTDDPKEQSFPKGAFSKKLWKIFSYRVIIRPQPSGEVAGPAFLRSRKCLRKIF